MTRQRNKTSDRLFLLSCGPLSVKTTLGVSIRPTRLNTNSKNMLHRSLYTLLFTLLLLSSIQAQPLQLNDSFGFGGITEIGAEDRRDVLRDVVKTADGKFVLIGHSYGPGANDWSIIMTRINANGTVDTSFGTDGMVLHKVIFRAIGMGGAIQPDGKIVVVGSDNTSNGVSGITAAIFRFNENGSVDTSFGDSGFRNLGFNGEFFDVHANDDGTIFAMGTNYASDTSVIFKFLEDASLDTTFSNDGSESRGPSVQFYSGYDAKVSDSGKMMTASIANVGGAFRVLLSATLATGEADTLFNSSGSVLTPLLSFGTNWESGIDLGPDKTVYIGGATGNSGTPDVTIFRYKENGELDEAFGDNGMVSFNNGDYLEVEQVITASDGGVYAMGYMISGGTGSGYVLKYTSDGELDTAFNTTGFLAVNVQNLFPDWLEEQADGGIILGLSQTTDFALARFSPLDNTSIEIPFEESEVAVYPNPVQGLLSISQGGLQGYSKLEIFDMLGRKVHVQALNPSSREQIKTEHLSPGTYLLRLHDERRDQSTSTKISISK